MNRPYVYVSVTLAIALALSVVSCRSKPSQHFTYTTLDASTKIDSLADKTPLRIIDFSGGQEENDNRLYYYQFVTVTETGDTVRVLTPAITVPGTGESAETHTSPLQFDPGKNVTEATFRNIASTDSAMLRLISLPDGQLSQTEKISEALNAAPIDEVLVTNTSLPSFERAGYRTVKGILHFNQVPW